VVTGVVSFPSRSVRRAISAAIRTAIFNGCGFGFGLFGKLQRYQLCGNVLGVWMEILIVSPLANVNVHFSPLESMWRSLTYRRKQLFRIRERAVA